MGHYMTHLFYDLALPKIADYRYPPLFVPYKIGNLKISTFLESLRLDPLSAAGLWITPLSVDIKLSHPTSSSKIMSLIAKQFADTSTGW